jgi:hypothetical protein
VLTQEELKNKAYHEMENIQHNTRNQTNKLEKEIRDFLNEKHFEGKLDINQFNKFSPTGSIPPSSWPAIKAHKPEKNFPARNIVSHIGAPQEAI